MNCQEFWDTMPELAGPAILPPHRRLEQHRHLEECAACAARLMSQRALKAGLRAMAGDISRLGAPVRVELRLRTAFRALGGIPSCTPEHAPQHAPQRAPAHTKARRRWAPILTWATAAAVIGPAALLVQVRQPEPAPPAASSPIQMAMSRMPAEIEPDGIAPVDNGFIALPNAAQIGPNEEMNLVRVEVPRSAMVALGFDVSPEQASEPVQADVMLGADGLARAVRFLD